VARPTGPGGMSLQQSLLPHDGGGRGGVAPRGPQPPPMYLSSSAQEQGWGGSGATGHPMFIDNFPETAAAPPPDYEDFPGSSSGGTGGGAVSRGPRPPVAGGADKLGSSSSSSSDAVQNPKGRRCATFQAYLVATLTLYAGQLFWLGVWTLLDNVSSPRQLCLPACCVRDACSSQPASLDCLSVAVRWSLAHQG
jgi:hypothetical protein